MRKLYVNSSGRCGGCVAVSAMPRLSRTAMNSSRTTHVEFTSSLHVREQFTTARQWRSRRCEGIYRASWKLLAIPEIASKETTYITETACRLKQSRHEEEQSREGQKLTGQRQRPLREIIPPVNHIKCRCYPGNTAGSTRKPETAIE